MNRAGTHRNTRDQSQLVRLEESLSTIFPADVSTAVHRNTGEEEIYSSEIQCISSANSSRRAEFIAGRHCARQAINRMNRPMIAIPIGHHGEPVWPDGLMGSISHYDSVCIAAISRRSSYRGIGTDLIAIDKVDPSLQRLIGTPPELGAIMQIYPDLRKHALSILFSLKESVYKCLFYLIKRRFDFLDVSFAFANGEAIFLGASAFTTDERALLSQIRYQIQTTPHFVISGAWIERPVPNARIIEFCGK